MPQSTFAGIRYGSAAVTPDGIAELKLGTTQLIADVRTLFEGSSGGPAPSAPLLNDPLLSLASTSSASFAEGVSNRASASKDLILHFLSRAPRPPASMDAADVDSVRARCRTLTAESASSRAELGIAEGKIKQLQTALEDAEERLRRAEKRLDRERSRIVKEVEGKLDSGAQESATAVKAEESPAKEEDSAAVGQNGVVKTDPDAPVAIVNGVDPADLESANDLAGTRLQELDRMQNLLAERTNELDALRLRVRSNFGCNNVARADASRSQLSHLPDDVVKESPAYRRLDKDLTAMQADAERTKLDLEAAQSEASSLREKQEEFRTAVLVRISGPPDQLH